MLHMKKLDVTFVVESPQRGLKYLGKVPLLYPTQLQKIQIFNWPTENMEP